MELKASGGITQGLPRKLDGLQVGRGLAALAVVMTHAVAHPYGGAPGAWHLLGRYGVTLFFVISGFIMVQTTGPGTFDPRRFMSNRIRRIVPIYWIANLILAITTLAAPGAFHRTEFNLPHVLLSLFFIPNYEPAGTGYIWPFFRLGWTLNYEMFFYVCFAALFALGARSRVLTISIVYVALIILGQMHPFTGAIPHFYTQVDTLGFIAGAWLGILGLGGHMRMRRFVVALLLVASMVGYLAIALEYEAIKDIIWTQVALVAVCMVHVGLLVTAIDMGGVKAPRGFVLAGDMSYSLYLFHMFAIGAVTAVALKLPHVLLFPMMAVSATSAVILGALVYRFLERPINDLMRRRGRPLTADQIGEAATMVPPDGHAPGAQSEASR